ncbi:hypothetical protein LY76DRAFT_586433 [Colletotrichum caudatum]|nr:hypothetical protein LY76DRAFT_586433 [Colletotrichum caudatum]
MPRHYIVDAGDGFARVRETTLVPDSPSKQSRRLQGGIMGSAKQLENVAGYIVFGYLSLIQCGIPGTMGIFPSLRTAETDRKPAGWMKASGAFAADGLSARALLRGHGFQDMTPASAAETRPLRQETKPQSTLELRDDLCRIGNIGIEQAGAGVVGGHRGIQGTYIQRRVFTCGCPLLQS